MYMLETFKSRINDMEPFSRTILEVVNPEVSDAVNILVINNAAHCMNNNSLI